MTLVPHAGSGLAAHSQVLAQQRALTEMWLEGRSPRTLAAYKNDLAHFAKFAGFVDGVQKAGEQAATFLVAQTPGDANAIVLAYRNTQKQAGLSPATINRRLAALRSFVKLARTVGKITWTLDVLSLKAEKYRDTKGPGRDGVEKLLKAAHAADGVRGLCILGMMFFMALRRGEIAALQLEHVDIKEKRVSILGKGRTSREWLTMPTIVFNDMCRWLVERGDIPGSLFRMSYRTMHRLVQRAGFAAGLGVVRPHGLRHSGITAALDGTHGDVRSVAKFSRHKDLNTLLIYDDNRKDTAGEIAEMLSRGNAPEKTPTEKTTEKVEPMENNKKGNQ